MMDREVELPSFPRRTTIPQVIYQTHSSPTLPPILEANIQRLTARNPDWQHCFFANEDFPAFIDKHYGSRILAIFERIDPTYGAARADLFRYLLMYAKGGVYLDIKSNCDIPLSDVIRHDDEFVLSHWSSSSHRVWKELRSVEGGELQQWHILCSPGHPFLRAVIERVLRNVLDYTTWQFGTAQLGVLRVTGPIAYTLAIDPLRKQHAHRIVNNHRELGLIYNDIGIDHSKLYHTHYLTNQSPLVPGQGVTIAFDASYVLLKRLKKIVRNLVKR